MSWDTGAGGNWNDGGGASLNESAGDGAWNGGEAATNCNEYGGGDYANGGEGGGRQGGSCFNCGEEG